MKQLLIISLLFFAVNGEAQFYPMGQREPMYYIGNTAPDSIILSKPIPMSKARLRKIKKIVRRDYKKIKKIKRLTKRAKRMNKKTDRIIEKANTIKSKLFE